MATFVIGDLHGYIEQYGRLLQTSNLCDNDLNWCGGSDQLWLIGDFFDRGASGIECLELTMKLQEQAASDGGFVNALLGNHELMILCAYRFPDETTSFGQSIIEVWQRWGGVAQDLQHFSDRHAEFIENLPAMALQDDSLLIHADSMAYVTHGTSIDTVNNSFQQLMESPKPHEWLMALDEFSEHMAFCGLPLTGTQRAEQLLKLYGGKRVIHGHTPIPYARNIDPQTVTDAWEYADGLCVNVDGGIFMGSPGFVYLLS